MSTFTARALASSEEASLEAELDEYESTLPVEVRAEHEAASLSVLFTAASAAASECANGEVRVYRLDVSYEPSGQRRLLAERVYPEE